VIEDALPLLDLSPTRGSVEIVLSAIAAYGERTHARADALLEALEARGREHPALGAALAAARKASP
jgi:hypothetical protein